jgi:hypothetical protein
VARTNLDEADKLLGKEKIKEEEKEKKCGGRLLIRMPVAMLMTSFSALMPATLSAAFRLAFLHPHSFFPHFLR